MAIGHPRIVAREHRFPVALILVRAGAEALADHGIALDGDQFQQPLPRQRQLARPVKGGHGLQQMQVRVHQLEIRITHVGRLAGRGRGPIFVEPLEVAAISFVVRLRLHQIEQPGRQVQRLFFARGQVILGQRVKSEGLAVDMFPGSQDFFARDVHFPVKTAVLLIPHFSLQKTITDVRRVQILLTAMAGADQVRVEPDHPRLRDNHLGSRTFQLSLDIVIENVAAIGSIQCFRIPKRDNVFRKVGFQPGPVDFCRVSQLLAGEAGDGQA